MALVFITKHIKTAITAIDFSQRLGLFFTPLTLISMKIVLYYGFAQNTINRRRDTPLKIYLNIYANISMSDILTKCLHLSINSPP